MDVIVVSSVCNGTTLGDKRPLIVEKFLKGETGIGNVRRLQVGFLELPLGKVWRRIFHTTSPLEG